MKVHYLLTLLFLTDLLYGCGQIGPLYLPGTPPPIHVEKSEQQPQTTEIKVEVPKESTKPTPSQAK